MTASHRTVPKNLVDGYNRNSYFQLAGYAIWQRAGCRIDMTVEDPMMVRTSWPRRIDVSHTEACHWYVLIQ